MPSESSPTLRFVVAQTGARRGYAVPLILQEAGMLDRFYTDVSGNTGWGRWLTWASALPWIGSKLRRLANRRIPQAICTKTHTFAVPNLRWVWESLWSPRNPVSDFRLDVRRQQAFCNASTACGFGQANYLYVMLSEFTPLLASAQNQGLKVVSEIYILISTNRLLAEERLRFPGWDPEPPDWDGVLKEFGYHDFLFKHVDYYLCPSENVASDLVENWNVPSSAIAVVPYGMSPEWLALPPATKPGSILFVGTADLRKGIHYLAMAAEILVKRGRNYEFRVAGHVAEQVLAQPLCRNLTFLGRVPRDRIHEEFQRADVFTLPSLAEGSAEVTYEALAAALPLVVTAAAGSVIRDGIEGKIVPERDPAALADAIEEIVENRLLRKQYAAAARQRASDYTWERYGDRLVAALKSFSI